MNASKQCLIFTLMVALSLSPLYSADFGQEQGDCSAQTGLAFVAGAAFVASTTFILLFGPQLKQLGVQRVPVAPRVTARVTARLNRDSGFDDLDQQFSSDDEKPKREKAGWCRKVVSAD